MHNPAPALALDWSNFDGPKRNPDWKPDDQDLIYTAINFRDDEYGDVDEDAGQQIAERLLAAWKLAADEVKRLRAAMGAEGQQFMQALVDEASTELQKRRAAEAELARLRSECADGLNALSDIDDFWEASPYPGNRKHLTPAEQISSLVCELNAAHDQVAALKSSGGEP